MASARRPTDTSRSPAREASSELQRGSQAHAPVAELGALARLRDVSVRVTLEWGTAQITLQEARELDVGALLRLDQQATDLVDVLVDGKLFGRGKLVMVGEVYGVQLVELAGGR